MNIGQEPRAKRWRKYDIFCSNDNGGAIVNFMNKLSAKKKRPVKASRAVGEVAMRKARPQGAARQPAGGDAMTAVGAVATAPVARSSALRAHKFRVGQTVFYTSSPITRPGATGSYKVVRLLPSDGDDYQYRIKNPGEAFERVAKESQLELEH